MQQTLEHEQALDWLADAIDAKGGPCCIPERERWELYEQAKRRLPVLTPSEYERRVRALAELLDL